MRTEKKKKKKTAREKSRECHNHKPQPFPDTKRKGKETKPNKRKSNNRTKSTKISSLFPKLGNRNAKRTEKHKNKITQESRQEDETGIHMNQTVTSLSLCAMEETIPKLSFRSLI